MDTGIETIVFDLDDTLLVEEDSAHAAFLVTCEHAAAACGVDAQLLCDAVRSASRTLWRGSPARAYCLRVGISSWEGLWAEFTGEDHDLQLLRQWSAIYRESSWRHALTACGVEDVELARELGDKFIGERRSRHILFDDALPALERLCQSHRLGLLTNGCPDLQRRKLSASGLGHFFDEVIVSGEVDIGKPDVRVFERLLSRLHTSAGAAAMVGNSLRSDIQPANALGMTSIWVNRSGNSSDSAIRPDIEISSLSEILGLEKSLPPHVQASRSHPDASDLRGRS